MSQKKHLLVISPNASRSGAPIVLLNLLNFLNQRGFIITLVIENSGPLIKKFDEITHKTYVLNPLQIKGHFFKRKFFQTINLLSKTATLFIIKRQRIDLIYANTATIGEIACPLKKSFPNIKLITHIHELQIQLEGNADAESLLHSSDQIIAVSNEVNSFLKKQFSICDSKIKTIYGGPKFIEKTIQSQQTISISRFIVGASGLADLRKGIDLFIQLCKITNEQSDSPIQFVWVGNNNEPYFSTLYNFFWPDIEKLGISEYITLTGQVDNPEDYFKQFDVFCLTSREDPFPLVCLEAASLGKPIICFDKGTGIKEFIKKDAGFVVPYMDLNAMAEKIIILSKDGVLCNQLGSNAKHKIQDEFSFEIMARKISDVIESLL